MNNLKYCKNCKKLFQTFGAQLCPACAKLIDEYFVKVRDYIYENPASSLAIVVDESGVPEKFIMQFLREGRISFTNPSLSGLECETCGAHITSGRLCAACSLKVQKELESASQDIKARNRSDFEKDFVMGNSKTKGVKMHTR